MTRTIADNNARFGAYTLDGRRKSWAIIGLTLDGAAYCADCADDSGISEAHWDTGDCGPIFADADVDGMTCDMCHEEIGS